MISRPPDSESAAVESSLVLIRSPENIDTPVAAASPLIATFPRVVICPSACVAALLGFKHRQTLPIALIITSIALALESFTAIASSTRLWLGRTPLFRHLKPYHQLLSAFLPSTSSAN